jgi:peptidyl-prolyl cis-trans isomerase C
MAGRKWKMAAFVGAAILGAWCGRSPAQNPMAADKPAAVVNGEPIFYADVDAILKLQQPGKTPPTEAQRRLMQHEALEMLMDDVVLRQFLKKNAPDIAPDVEAKKFAELEAGLKAQKRTLQDFLRETGETEQQLRIDIHKMLQWAAYVSKSVSEEDLKRYFTEYRDYFDRVTVRVSHILIRVAPTALPAEREQARARLLELRQQIASGKLDFAEAAKKYSQCATAPTGGDIGFIPRKWAVEEAIARAAFALKVGELSDVIQTDYGFHLLKATDRKPGLPADYALIKDEVRETYVEDMRQAVLAQERKTAHIEVNMP